MDSPSALHPQFVAHIVRNLAVESRVSAQHTPGDALPWRIGVPSGWSARFALQSGSIRCEMDPSWMEDTQAATQLASFHTELARRLARERVRFDVFDDLATHVLDTYDANQPSPPRGRVHVRLRDDADGSVFVRLAEVAGEEWVEVYQSSVSIDDLNPRRALELSSGMRACQIVSTGRGWYHVRFRLPLGVVSAERLLDMMYEVLDACDWVLQQTLEE